MGITCWFRNLTVKAKSQIDNLVKPACKIMGTPVPSTPQEPFEQACIKHANNIRFIKTAARSSEYVLLNSRRVGFPYHLKHLFIPISNKLVNERLAGMNKNVTCVQYA